MNKNIKKIIVLSALVALTGARCWGAADDESCDESPLVFAAKIDDVEEVQRLLDAGADINEHSCIIPCRTALIEAALWGHKEMVEALLQHDKLDVTALDTNLDNAFNIAARRGHAAIVKMLLDKCAGKERPGQRTALMEAAMIGQDKVVQILLDDGRINIDAVDYRGYTALKVAVATGRADIVRMLLGHNADASIPDYRGETALDLARQRGEEKVIEALEQGPMGG